MKLFYFIFGKLYEESSLKISQAHTISLYLQLYKSYYMAHSLWVIL